MTITECAGSAHVHCCKSHQPILGDSQIWGYHSSKIPEHIEIKFDVGDYVGDVTSHVKFKMIVLLGSQGVWKKM